MKPRFWKIQLKGREDVFAHGQEITVSGGVLQLWESVSSAALGRVDRLIMAFGDGSWESVYETDEAGRQL